MISRRRLSTEEKVALIQRLRSGVSVSALARETGILRKSLYEWHAAYLAMGAAGLNRKRGDLARAQARIAELERVIGRQQVALDFFREALRSWDAKRRKSAATISSDSSEK